MEMKSTKFVQMTVSLLVCVFITGCSGESQEAKNLGFDSLEEMKDIHKQGWHTKNQYNEDTARINGFSNYAEMKAFEEKKKIELEEKKKKTEQAAKNREKFSSACTYDLASVIYDYRYNGGRLSGATEIIGYYIQAVRMRDGADIEKKLQITEKKNVAHAGIATFQGRKVPACIEKVQLHFVNQLQGFRTNKCYALAYIYDGDFQMYRSMKSMECHEIDSNIDAWTKDANVSEIY